MRTDGDRLHGFYWPYLGIASNPEVGAVQLDPRPAFVLAADGSRLLWANAAGAAFFGERRLDDLLRLRFSDLNPIKIQAARLAKLLPSAAARVEILRFGMGTRLATMTAACRRLNLANDERAVLAIGAGVPFSGSATARAELLVDMIDGGNCVAAVLTGDGKVLAASGAFEALFPAEPAIDRLIDEARTSSQPLSAAAIGNRGAGVARFNADGRPLFLVVVGPAEMGEEREVVTEATAPDETAIEAMFPEFDGADDEPPEVQPAEPPAPVVRFAWETDAAGCFRFVSPDLATVVGAANAAVAGRSWDAVKGPLGLDPEDDVAVALQHGNPFATTVYWPVADTDERMAIDLSGRPIRVGGEAGAGFRGFGVARTDDRQPDLRTDRSGLPPAPEEAAADSAPPGPTGETGTEPSRDDLDDAARKSIEEGTDRRRTPTLVSATDHSNVVRLTSAATRTPTEALTGSEREAFKRIAEALGKQPAAADGVAEPPRSVSVDDTGEAAMPDPTIDVRLLDRLPIGVVIFRDRKTLFANRVLIELLGYDSFEAFVAAGGADAVFPGGERLSGNIVEAGGKLAARGRDGTTVPVRAWLHAVTFAGATALMLSVAAGRLADGDGEDALAVEIAASQARADELEAILDTATDGVIVIDGRGKIGSMNRAAEALFGINAGDYVGRYFTDLLADESQKPALDYLDGLAENGVASVLNDGREVIGRVPNGGLIPLFMTMGRIDGTDKFCAVLRDITHWKNVEGELTAARRAAEAANQQKSDFLAKISHEIRTPLNAIIGFSEVMMEERFGPIGNTRYRDYLRDIHVSGAHLMSLINDLLDLSKIEAGKVELHFEAVAANAVIQECVALMQPQANRERIIIRTSLAADLPSVVADPRSFRQILLNLLSNATKFTRAGGQVIVSTTLEESGEVVVRVRDTGIGMSEKDIETALKPFRQVALAADDREHGTGLGLPLTKALVEANRATFGIESAPNQGTLVKITFPTTRVLAG